MANALDMMLTGKNIRAHKAKKMGLVDAVVVGEPTNGARVTVVASTAEQHAEREHPRHASRAPSASGS